MPSFTWAGTAAITKPDGSVVRLRITGATGDTKQQAKKQLLTKARDQHPDAVTIVVRSINQQLF